MLPPDDHLGKDFCGESEHATKLPQNNVITSETPRSCFAELIKYRPGGGTGSTSERSACRRP